MFNKRRAPGQPLRALFFVMPPRLDEDDDDDAEDWVRFQSQGKETQ